MATTPDDALTRLTRHDQLLRRATTPPPSPEAAPVEEVIEALRAITARHPGLSITVTIDNAGTPTTARITARTGTPEVIRLVPTPEKPQPAETPPPDQYSYSAARLADMLRKDPALLEAPKPEVLPHPTGALPRRPEPPLPPLRPVRPRPYPYPDRPPYPD